MYILTYKELILKAVFVHVTRKCVLRLVATGTLHVNCCDKHEKYKTLTAMIWVTSILLIPVTQRSCEDINVN